MLQIGSVLDNKYEILKKIGQGGMSVVYLAMDNRINKSWAVKEVKKTAADKNNRIVYQSFISEANLMKKLDHPSLPRIVDIIENNETICVVMDYVEGEPLSNVVKNSGPQAQTQVIEWGKQLCDVLRYLHSQTPPIIYRDMKPANVMLKPNGKIELIDFGIAREYKAENTNDTIPLGTHGYAPPEQTLGKCQTDARTDIYSLGVTLFNLLTGCDPRTTQDYNILHYNSELSEGLANIINKCTERFPEERYQSCDRLMYALEHYEEYDEHFRKKLKRKIALFAVTVSISLVTLAGGITVGAYGNYQESRSYESLIDVSESTEDDVKLESYKKAVELIPEDTRAYMKILEVYKNSQFTDKESNEFMTLFNRNKDNMDTQSRDWLELNYQIGITYFYCYTGGDNSARTRILKAQPYFETVKKSSDKDYEFYSVSCSYSDLGSFYNTYVQNGINEPDKKEYLTLIGSINDCIQGVDDYNMKDSSYIKLTMYQEIMNMIKDRAGACAQNGIEEKKLTDIISLIYDKTQKIVVTREVSENIKKEILEGYQDLVLYISEFYSSVQR